MGTRFLAAALILCSLWYAWPWNRLTLSFWGVILRVLLWSFLAAGLGKIVGIIAFRFHARKA